jgi:hypothetical protein
MTNERMRIVIAESLGFTRLGIYEGVNELYGDPPGCRGHVQIPHYPESLDACAEFEKTLTDDDTEHCEAAEYLEQLCFVCGDGQDPLNVRDIDLGQTA